MKTKNIAVDQDRIILKTADFVMQKMKGAEGGHDWWHTYRVWKMSVTIATEENADLLIVQLAALLHDIADSKFHNGNEEIGPEIASKFMEDIKIDKDRTERVVEIIRNLSFKNTFDNINYSSIELDVVRDADRLDAIGAIGIARTFNYGGFTGSEIYNPEIKPKNYKDKSEYKSSNPPTINHFYEKLLKLKDLMTTDSGKRLAQSRHEYMEHFLSRFYSEWEGIK